MPTFLSFRRRLALVHVVVIAAVLAVAASLTYLSLVTALRGQLDGALLALAEQEASTLADHPDLPVTVHERADGAAPPSYARLDRLVQIIDARGGVLARSANLGASTLPTDAALLARLAGGEAVFENLSYGEEPTRRVSVPVRAPGRAFAVQVAGSLDDVDHAVDSAGLMFLSMGIVLVVVITLAGALLTGRVFGAIDDVVRQAQRIGDHNLSDRLPHPGSRDEIGRLVDTLNDMLARLERAFEAQRRFTADASHELRSPLSRLRAELEITLRRPRDGVEYVGALQSCLDEVERLTMLVEELLTLARLDSGQESGQQAPVALVQLVEEVVRRAQGTAQRHGVRVRLDVVETAMAPTAGLRAVPPMLALVVSNLVDNAIKYNAAGGMVLVSLGADDDGARITVEDDGPGVPDHERPHLFERFYRGASARGDEVPGTGLGLALCQSIARVLGGCIEVEPSPLGGERFTVRLPTERASAPERPAT
ncbi:two-component sensor histidine kinase [Roseateles aquatilis]|uniref:histidine kinase n=1 Tax=Roseateles aquatilis TaxID=431061 RepID=A0A246IW25_9BURK|nr:ATP-binding protein [Roseateles aquatilis]OWQ84410.1 two-component sensor histidine kinase [Roseateles aquatilis]